ncbi:putative DnaJ subfamily B member 5 [Monoraphidium neglectum]|uniref:Putative DnaJ subfamily B member 5 n=1 Tax=Monoraphidium neglectum TaxID=145388 RepID=A0A0D2MK93_9CHLO|nr:putative DnaJ subfamily B member 5 [Monoraphidium neglectum]KIY95340.1 putative DnaJ subfamily B member 5 [Monoraphidium neglectum]|eukprot:XP_013894360.1 putative DnaJ subfamily B member 5 [Monoraphidium neglectum]
MAADLDFDGKSPYEVLGLEKGPESTADEIKKAYRRLALIKHPDKAKTPNAAAEFAELQKAYQVLSDAAARGALDDYLCAKAAREARYAQQDGKRRKMREDLEQRERTVVRERTEEEKAKARLKQPRRGDARAARGGGGARAGGCLEAGGGGAAEAG